MASSSTMRIRIPALSARRWQSDVSVCNMTESSCGLHVGVKPRSAACGNDSTLIKPRGSIATCSSARSAAGRMRERTRFAPRSHSASQRPCTATPQPARSAIAAFHRPADGDTAPNRPALDAARSESGRPLLPPQPEGEPRQHATGPGRLADRPPVSQPQSAVRSEIRRRGRAAGAEPVDRGHGHRPAVAIASSTHLRDLACRGGRARCAVAAERRALDGTRPSATGLCLALGGAAKGASSATSAGNRSSTTSLKYRYIERGMK